MGVWNRGSEVVGPRMYPQFAQCWGDCVVNPMGLLGEMHFRTVHPGDGRSTHLFIGSCTATVKGSPWELTPPPTSGSCSVSP